MRAREVVAFVALALAALPAAARRDDTGPPPTEEAPPDVRADRLWERRAEGREEDRARREPAASALELYEGALGRSPDDLEARSNLLRALFFVGDYVETDDETRLAIFERGKTLAEEGLDRLAEAVGGRQRLDQLSPSEVARRLEGVDQAAPAYVWAAIHWGLWGRTTGKMAAARQGVAGKIRDYAERAIALDPLYDGAAGHRILGRLHAEAPRIPFVTGWIDRDRAIAELERAVALAPEDRTNQLYLAEALIEFDRDRRDEGIERLERLLTWRPRPELEVEDARALAEARRLHRRVATP